MKKTAYWFLGILVSASISIGVFVYLKYSNDFGSFLVSLSSGLFVLLAGVVGYLVYLKQKDDHLMRIAHLVYADLDHAEAAMAVIDHNVNSSKVAMSPLSQDTAPIYPADNWLDNRTIFVGQLDDDVLRLIDSAVRNLIRLEKYRVLAEELFKEQVLAKGRERMHFVHKRYSKSASKFEGIKAPFQGEDKEMADIESGKVMNFKDHFAIQSNSADQLFTPQEIKDQYDQLSRLIPKIINTSAGEKLKALATPK